VAAGTAVAVVLGLVAGVAFWSRAQRRATWLAEQRATVERLASSAQFPAAFRLAEDIERRAPGDSALRAMRPAFADMIRIVTKPAGARITRREVLRAGAPWTFVGTTPADSVPMPKTLRELSFRLRIELPGYEPREVLPDIFAGPNAVDTLRLDRAGEAPGFVRIPGFSMIDRLHAGGGRVVFADYHIGRHEVTNGEFARFVAAGGYEKSEYWTEPFVREGRSVPWRDAVKEFRDRTGMPGPATWSGGRFPAGQDSFPVAGVSYYEAAAYARFAGARLPTSVHWSRAALRNNREASWIYLPESNLNGSGVRAVGRGEINAFGLYDVAGNVREWCANPMPGGHLLRGASWEDDAYWVTGQVMRPDWDRSAGNGFRLVRFSDNDTTIAHLAGPVAPTPSRDFSVASRVTDTEYSFYQRLFDYDHTPLNARVDTQGVVGAYRWEKVSFDAPYRGERMSAYVLLPKTHTAPFEPILFWSHAGVLTARTFDPGHWSFENYIGFLPQNGRAVVFPVLKGMFERDDSAFSIVWRAPEKTAAYRDLVIQWIKEIRRTVDYIESRADIKADRLGFFSFSWGSQMAPMALALEPRFKAAVINLGGYWPEGEAFPEVELSTYASRVRIPALLLNGEYDTVFPYATNQRPFFEQLGTPAKDKKHVRYPTSHSLPADALARETLSWFDRYLTSGAPR
jgi:dienelactone hydrolase